MNKYKIAEKFISINGEARKAGELSVFIRLVGCNLRCNYCDTLWACDNSAPGEMMTEDEIYDYIKKSGVKNVTITGGEPMLADNIKALLLRLSSDKDLSIEVETNSAVLLTEYYKEMPANISFTVDYKCPGSGMEKAMVPENFANIRNNDTVKFVVSDKNDLDKMCEIIETHNLTEKCMVYVSAVFGRIKPDEIVNYMIEHKMNDVRLQLQIHKYIWDPDKKGV